MSKLRKILFAAWVAAALILGSYASGAHAVVYPAATASPRADTAIAALLGGGEGLVHVLYAKCKCSGAIVDHLLRKKRSTREVLLLVGDLDIRERELVGRGFELRHISVPQLERTYSIRSAPLLVVVGGDGLVRYRGGYRETEFGPIHDEEIRSKSLESEGASSLPLFGCAVSRGLKRIVDPFSLKD